MKKINRSCQSRFLFALPLQLLLFLNLYNSPAASPIPFSVSTGHNGPILSTAVAPDGTSFFSGSTDNTVKIWSFSDHRLIATLRGHTGAVRALAVSPDGKLTASGSADHTVIIWNGSKQLHELTGHSGAITCLAFSHDGSYLVSGSQDSTLRLWSTTTFEQERTYRGHNGAVSSVAISRDNKLIISGSYDNTIRFWSPNSTPSQQPINAHSDKVLSVALSPDGALIASTSCDNTIKFWRTANGTFLRKIRTGLQVAYCSSFSPDGRYLVTGDDLGDLRLYNIVNPSDYTLTYAHHRAAVTSIALSSDGASLFSGSMDSTILKWDMPASPLVDSIIRYPSTIFSTAISSGSFDTARLAVADGSDIITLWSLREGTVAKCLSNHGKCDAVSFSGKGTVLAAGCDDSVKIYDLQHPSPPKVLEGQHTRTVRSLVFSPSDALIASACSTGIIIVHSVKTGKPLYHLKKRFTTESVTALAFPAVSDKFLLSGTSGGSVTVWSLSSGKAMRTIGGKSLSAPVSAIAFSPNDSLYAIGTEDGTIQIRSGSDHTLFEEQRLPTASITALRFTDDNSGIVVGSATGELSSFSVGPLKKSASIMSDGAITTLCTTGGTRSPVIAGDNRRRLQWWTPVDSSFFLTSCLLADSAFITFNQEGTFTASGQVTNNLPRYLSFPGNDRGLVPDDFRDRYLRPRAIDSTISAHIPQTRKGPNPSFEPSADMNNLLDPQRGKKYAIIIGIADYKNLPKYTPQSNSLTDLKYSDNDAAAFKRFIDDTARSGRNWKTFYMVNDQATKTAMDGALTPVLQNARSEDLVVIFFSGHGRSHPDKADDVYLLSYDFIPTDYRSGFAYDDLLDLIINCKAAHVIAYIDACKSGMIGIKGSDWESGIDIDRIFKRIGQLPDNKIIFTSSKGTQVSWEDDEYRMGTFSYFLVHGLNGCASESPTLKDNFVNLGELEEYVTENVRNRTRDRSLQTPEVREVKGNIQYSLPLAYRTGAPEKCPAVKTKSR